MSGLDLDNGHLRRYLGRRLVILLGDADNDPSAPDLPRTDYAMAQGPHRLARGLWHFQHCTKLADSLGVHFGWRLEIAHGAGHVGQQIYEYQHTEGSELIAMTALLEAQVDPFSLVAVRPVSHRNATLS
jgi:hypothetical protein